MERVTGGEAPSADTARPAAEQGVPGAATRQEAVPGSAPPATGAEPGQERPSAPPSLNLTNHQAIDPMVGMDGMTPYDFMDSR